MYFLYVRNFNGVGVRRVELLIHIGRMKVLKFEHGIDHVMWLDDDFCIIKMNL